jgi:putative membrane protein
VTIEIADLPHFNAAFNGLTIICLVAGLAFIRSGDRHRHRLAMLSALVVSACFLITYLIYHFNAGLAKFGGEGLVRPFYFALLITHVLVAVAITPLVPVTVYRALRGRFERHKRLARWTWPLWFFVAVSGVAVYLMAVHWFPDPAGPYAHG